MNYEFPGLGPQLAQYFTDEFNGTENLTAKELEIIKKAAPKRQRDFSTGRYCANVALQKSGNLKAEILQGSGKEPIWPAGIVGSISHSKKLTGAIVARVNDIVSIGLDIETIGGVKPDMWDMLFTTNEQEFLKQTGIDQIELYTTLFFSFKECFYKFQYPLTNLYVDFLEVELQYLNGDFKLIMADSLLQLLPSVGNLKLLWDKVDDQVISICYLTIK